MRILYINFNLNRFDSEAGVWARELVHELSAAGAEVVTFPDLDDTEPAANRSGGNTASGLKAVMRRRLPQSVSLKLIEYYLQIRGLKRTLQMSWTLWRKRKDLDCGVILARTYEYDWTPLIAARLFRRPLVLEVHTPFYMERQIRGSPASKLLRRFERVQWRAADRIWVNSHELESIIGRDLQTTDRITCIPHGIRMDQFGPEPCRRDRETVSVVFVGSFYHWHGAELLIEAFARSREQVASLRLCLIGDGLTRPACEAKASQLGVCDAVEFTGWIARDRVADYLAASDIGVAPYLKLETFYFDPLDRSDRRRRREWPPRSTRRRRGPNRSHNDSRRRYRDARAPRRGRPAKDRRRTDLGGHGQENHVAVRRGSGRRQAQSEPLAEIALVDLVASKAAP
jgi:glycosyltransferase involved in cell wall biosynthesis